MPPILPTYLRWVQVSSKKNTMGGPRATTTNLKGKRKSAADSMDVASQDGEGGMDLSSMKWLELGHLTPQMIYQKIPLNNSENGIQKIEFRK